MASYVRLGKEIGRRSSCWGDCNTDVSVGLLKILLDLNFTLDDEDYHWQALCRPSCHYRKIAQIKPEIARTCNKSYGKLREIVQSMRVFWGL